MAEILGAGVTHYPPMLVSDDEKAFPINITLARDERVPEHMKNPANWPEAMRVEYGEDEGVASAVAHRERLVRSFRVVNDEIQAFEPDFVVIFGDDQYENFRETIIPPFCILAYEESESTPFQKGFAASKRNAWDEPSDKAFRYRGHPEGARWLTTQLIEQGVDMAYAYKPLHDPGLPHSILNTLLFLDYDRKGFNIPVVPFAVNCYGSKVISNRGGILPHKENGKFLEPDPPGPSIKRCMQVGAATARALMQSPWRVALGGFVQLVPRLPDRKEPLSLAGYRFRSGHVRGPAGWRLRRVEGRVDAADRGGGPAGVAELGLPAGSHGRTGTEAGSPRLCRDLRLQLQQVHGCVPSLAECKTATEISRPSPLHLRA